MKKPRVKAKEVASPNTFTLVDPRSGGEPTLDKLNF